LFPNVAARGRACHPAAGMKDIKFLAIIVGVVTDVASTQVILLKFVFFCAIVLRIEGQDFRPLLSQHSLSTQLPEMALGGLGSFLGGFVAGRMAKTAEIKNTLLMGLLSNATGFAFFHMAETWVMVAGSAMTFAAATLGGYLALLIRREEPLAP
jgi:hypothetical protein